MAERTEISAELNALSVHCRPPIMEVEQRALWLRDWCSDLAEFPIEAVRIACRKWRLSGATKFPTPGQLMPLVRENLPTEKGEAAREWSPADDAEYRAMSVREKIREHQILAQQAYRKAGPMFRNGSASGAPMSKASGTHLTPEEMPASHAHWVAQAQNHLADAQRLRQYLNGVPAIAAAR
jgi:hypothetical protein